MAYTVIDHEELTGALASWTSVTIPSSYDILLLMVSAQTDQAVVNSSQLVQFNGDDGANYASTNMYASSTASFTADHQDSALGISYPMVTGSSVDADVFGAFSMWVPHYANTDNYKAVIVQSTSPDTTLGNGQVRLTSGRWESTAAITSITVVGLTGDDFQQYSTFTLYGLTSA